MVKYGHDYESMKSERIEPYWWKTFVSIWKKCSTAEGHGQYQTDKTTFMCSCPAWLRSQFFLCKHIVQQRQCPKYHQVTIRRSPPFIIIDESSTRVIANVDDELLLYPSNQANEAIPSPPQVDHLTPISMEQLFTSSINSAVIDSAEPHTMYSMLEN